MKRAFKVVMAEHPDNGEDEEDMVAKQFYKNFPLGSQQWWSHICLHRLQLIMVNGFISQAIFKASKLATPLHSRTIFKDCFEAVF